MNSYRDTEEEMEDKRKTSAFEIKQNRNLVSCHLSITLQTTLGKDSAVKVAKFLTINLASLFCYCNFVRLLVHKHVNFWAF